MGILVGNVGLGVDHQDDHVGILDRLQRLDHRELLDRLEDLAALPHARRIDEHVMLAAALEVDLDGIARRARGVEGDDALLAEQGVDQRRLADVGAADDGDAHGIGLLLFVLRVGEGFEGQLDQPAHPFAMRGRNGVRLAQPEFVEFRLDHAGIHAFRLVDRDQHRTVDAAQAVGDFLVVRRDAGARIDDEEDCVGLGDRLLGLARHFAEDAVLDQRFETAGVDHQIRLATQLAVPVVAVAGQPRQVGDDGVARPGQAVEQGRLADVGAADQDQGRLHRASIRLRLPPEVCTRNPEPAAWTGTRTGEPSVFWRATKLPSSADRMCT